MRLVRLGEILAALGARAIFNRRPMGLGCPFPLNEFDAVHLAADLARVVGPLFAVSILVEDFLEIFA